MVNFSGFLEGVGKDKQDVKDQLGKRDETFPILIKAENETIRIIPSTVVIKKRTITGSDGFILGHPNYGVLGTNTLGSPTYTSYSSQKVVSPNNTFLTYFRDIIFKDSGNTTATWDGTSQKITFTTGQVAQSELIYKDDDNIVSANLSAEGTNLSNLTFYLSANNGANWEQVNNNSSVSFVNVSNELKFKIVASGNAELTKLQITYTKE